MKIKFITILSCILTFLIFSAATFEKPKQEEGFENLKILPKDIGIEKLDSIMNVFTVSLGVKCSFCHAHYADTTNKHLEFASDKKDEKLTARQMYLMTAEINANFFNDNHSTRPDTIHEIVCYTCHRGTKSPEAEGFMTIIDSTLKSSQRGKLKK